MANDVALGGGFTRVPDTRQVDKVRGNNGKPKLVYRDKGVSPVSVMESVDDIAPIFSVKIVNDDRKYHDMVARGIPSYCLTRGAPPKVSADEEAPKSAIMYLRFGELIGVISSDGNIRFRGRLAFIDVRDQNNPVVTLYSENLPPNPDLDGVEPFSWCVPDAANRNTTSPVVYSMYENIKTMQVPLTGGRIIKQADSYRPSDRQQMMENHVSQETNMQQQYPPQQPQQLQQQRPDSSLSGIKATAIAALCAEKGDVIVVLDEIFGTDTSSVYADDPELATELARIILSKSKNKTIRNLIKDKISDVIAES
jgi:hypothetical protein